MGDWGIINLQSPNPPIPFDTPIKVPYTSPISRVIAGAILMDNLPSLSLSKSKFYALKGFVTPDTGYKPALSNTNWIY